MIGRLRAVGRAQAGSPRWVSHAKCPDTRGFERIHILLGGDWTAWLGM
jgi:hypothetical protein